MPNLDDILSDAQGGEAMDMLGREFGLTPDQIQAAVTALLPAISTGLKRATATPEGLSNLLAVMSQQPHLGAMYDDPDTAFAQPGRDAGNDVLSVIFGSPDVSRAVAERAQVQSGIASSILKKLLPVIVGMLISGMLGRRSSEASPPSAPMGTPAGGGIWDILEQVFGRAMAGSSGTAPTTAPQQVPADQQFPNSGGPLSDPSNSGGPAAPGGDLIAVILRELQKAIQEGRPVVVQAPMPGGQTWPMPSDTPIPDAGNDGLPDNNPSVDTAPSGEMLPGPKMTPNTQAPGGDILGNILRDIFGGAGAGTRPSQAGLGAAVFGDRFETGSKIDERDQANLQAMFDQVFGGRRA
jgi:hypothetical protein